ncbi:MAG: S41 family peptidase [Deltaproteobacteria bacterium]|nr:S41 family peptidase [Deltaproteobacteria bacterium]
MKRSTGKAFTCAFWLCVLISGLLFFQGSGADVKAGTDEVYKNIEVFAEVLRQIEENYVEPQDSQELIYGAIKGMVESLDPHSAFMTKQEHKDLMIETKGSFSGVGIEITTRDNLITVVSPIEGTPAYKAGIKAGDQIIKINDEPTNDMNLSDAVKRIRGPQGSEVKLTVRREGSDKPLDFTITRDVIPLRSVRHHQLTPEVGYVRISNFQSKTERDLKSALRTLEEGEIKGLILDLRNNPGGLLDQAIKVSDLFLDEGLIVSTKGRDSSQNMEISAQKSDRPRSYPMIVLVNEGSASASEIVAGALQDNKRALILGTKTFGKGSVQTILPLSDGSGLRLTTARYYTPSGNSIQLEGIIPDIELAFVPPRENGEDTRPHFLREKDLKGHMDNDKHPEEQAPEGEEGEAEGVDERAEELLERDNQVRHALQLLQTWNIFSQIKAAP